ncbi:MAG: hypothetical protein AAGL24_00135 [Pseudomonadota bacterium]
MTYYYFEFLRRYADWLDERPVRATAIFWGVVAYNFIFFMVAPNFSMEWFGPFYIAHMLVLFIAVPFFWVTMKKDRLFDRF